MRFYEVDRRPDHPRRRRHRRRCPARSCARNIGMVLQDTWLFGGTIAREHRLRRGRTRRTRRSSAAAQAAHVDRFVRTLPDGYDTVIDEEGAQRQRGREAADHHRPGVPGRAGDPDPRRGDQLGRHPHRGADPAGDEHAARAAGPASSSRTGSPRSATPTLILVMEHGRIVEQGTHDELLARRRRLRPALRGPVRPGHGRRGIGRHYFLGTY